MNRRRQNRRTGRDDVKICFSRCFHIGAACGRWVNFAALVVVHSHRLCVAVARPPHISATSISGGPQRSLIFARRAPPLTESGHCWDEGSGQVSSTARRIVTLVAMTYCARGRSPSRWNSPLETLGMSGIFFGGELFGMSGPRVTTTHAPLLVPSIHHCTEGSMGTGGFLLDLC